MGLRPEAVAAPGYGSVEIELPVEVVEPTGSDVFIWLDLNGQHVSSRFAATFNAPEPGALLKVSLDLKRAVIFDSETTQRIG